MMSPLHGSNSLEFVDDCDMCTTFADSSLNVARCQRPLDPVPPSLQHSHGVMRCFGELLRHISTVQSNIIYADVTLLLLFIMSSAAAVAAAAALFQSTVAQKNAATKERMANGNGPYVPKSPFAVLDVEATAITVSVEDKLNRKTGKMSESYKLTTMHTMAEYNAILASAGGHGKGPVENNQFGYFLHTTLSKKMRDDDAALMERIKTAALNHERIRFNINLTDWEITEDGKTISGWYASFNHFSTGSN